MRTTPRTAYSSKTESLDDVTSGALGEGILYKFTIYLPYSVSVVLTERCWISIVLFDAKKLLFRAIEAEQKSITFVSESR